MRKLIKRNFSGTTNPEVSDRERASAQVAYEAACEGFVLLKNNGVLPLDKTKSVALYGRGAAKTIKGGTGSGDVNERKSITIYEGMTEAGFPITTRDWLDAYSREYDKARLEWKETIFEKIRQMQEASGVDSRDGNEFFICYTTTPFTAPTGAMPEKTDADTAICVISRVAGEGADRYLEPGDYYLSTEEEKFLQATCQLYKDVVLVINAGAVLDLSILDEEWATNIGAVLLISQSGQEGGRAFADVISGKVSPSGKLTDTWPMKYEDIPFANEFAHLNDNLDYEEYKEDIYVGYRYFDTCKKPIRFCFGHGLSYTDFDISLTGCKLIDSEEKVRDCLEKNISTIRDVDGIEKNNDSDLDNIENNIEKNIDSNLDSKCAHKKSCRQTGKEIEITVNVKNTGSCAGKEVVQVYVSLPQGKGTMPKEFRRLMAYAKTDELEAGQSQELTLIIKPDYLTSFDEERSAYILDSGIYGIWVGSSLDSAKLQGALVVCDNSSKALCQSETVAVGTDENRNSDIYRVDHVCKLENKFDKLKLDDVALDSRYKEVLDYVNHKGANEETSNYVNQICVDKKENDYVNQTCADKESISTANDTKTAEGHASKNIIELDLSSLQHITCSYSDDLYHGADEIDRLEIKEAEEFVSNLTLDECCMLAMGDPTKQHNGILGAAGSTVPGCAGETNHVAEDRGLAGLPLADGPAGLRILKKYMVHEGKVQYIPFMAALENGFFYDEPEQEGQAYYQYCTAFPVDVCLAQTWNDRLVAKVGRAVATEMDELGITLWLAPGMNIHRNPLCGRNFEYYAEDPLLSGKIAAAMTRGVQSIPGTGTTIKHFCCNNSEDNRFNSDSRVSERALREIYLRGFEIAVKESQPMAIMTSYNLVNGIHTANNYDLCTKVARNEWGFKGLIMSDWATTIDGRRCISADCMKAGNDVIMPGMQADMDNIKEQLAAGILTEEALRKCITRLVRVVFKSNQYEQ